MLVVVLAAVPVAPATGLVVVVVVVGVPSGGFGVGAVWLAGLAGVGVLSSAASGLAAM